MNRRAALAVTSLLGAAFVATSLVGAQAAAAAPKAADKVYTLTSAQLTKLGYTAKPNLDAWGPGGKAKLPVTTAAQWQDVVITGKAPNFTQPGQLLTMSRYQPSSPDGMEGTTKPLNITAVVQKDRSFTMHFQLGMTGTYGYTVGYATDSSTPENIDFLFQFTTTGSGKPAPSAGKSTAVHLSSKKLTEAGFTKTPNVAAFNSGTATLSTNVAKAGAPVTLKGKAPASFKPGTVMTLQRFTATDKLGSGSFEPVGNIQTVVAADGTYTLTFEINETGLYGYSFGAAHGEEWIGTEFQLKTT
jgi:hypothetical protein